MMKPKDLFKIFKEGRIKPIGDRGVMFEVDKHIVSCQNKPGRSILTCDCHNHTRFCNTPIFCMHKENMITYPIFKYYDEKLEELISHLNISTGNEGVSNKEIIIMLENIRRFK